MDFGNVAVYVILAAIVGLAVYGTVKRARHGSSCCGEREAAPKKVKYQTGKHPIIPTFMNSVLTACTAQTAQDG